MTKAALHYYTLDDVVPMAEGLLNIESNIIANMSNVSALLYEALPDVNWVGFYRLIGNELVLGPFQGRIACTRIAVGNGVCGTAVAEDEVQRIPDVLAVSNHIACDRLSQSEIVLPIHHKGEIYGVLDIDSPIKGRFKEDDQQMLEKLVSVFERHLQIIDA